MANVAHASLTGSNLHEPKGADTAAAGQVYISNGLGSGSWSTVTGLVFTGMVADFTTPIAPAGWLECDGSVISAASYPALYAAMCIQLTGTRVGGLAIITGISSTSSLRPGYHVAGTGITAGTILSVDSSTQITMSTNALSSGTNTVIFSPWTVSTTNITLPDLTSLAKFRRSRTTTDTIIGAIQNSQNQAHSHNGSTNNGGVDHSHSGTTGTDSVDHHHDYFGPPASQNGTFTGPGGNGWGGSTQILQTSGIGAQGHTHSFTTGGASSYVHSHGFSTDSNGGSEARPTAVVFMTCVKT